MCTYCSSAVQSSTVQVLEYSKLNCTRGEKIKLNTEKW